MPKSFYDATTGIEPLDDTIKKCLNSGYAHHIERLMIIGNFMLLCEFDPKEVQIEFAVRHALEIYTYKSQPSRRSRTAQMPRSTLSTNVTVCKRWKVSTQMGHRSSRSLHREGRHPSTHAPTRHRQR